MWSGIEVALPPQHGPFYAYDSGMTFELVLHVAVDRLESWLFNKCTQGRALEACLGSTVFVRIHNEVDVPGVSDRVDRVGS